MEFVKIVFEAFDKILNKSQNEVVEIEGEENLSILTDIQYSNTKKFNALLDIYYKKNNIEHLPVLIYIHGGGFIAGGKEYRTAIAKWLAVQGYFVVNVNYGLSPECVFPQQFKHLAAAMKWIKKNQKNYKLNLEKVVVAGDSAGAYYASMLACISNSAKLQEKLKIGLPFHFAGVVLNCGLYDLKSVLNRRLAFDLNSKIFEMYTGINRDEVEHYKYKDYCSPLTYISKKFPPTFIIYSEKDILCMGQAERLIKKLKEKDVYFESFCSENPFVNHCFSLEWKTKQAQRANYLQSLFLQNILNNSLPLKMSEAEKGIHEKM